MDSPEQSARLRYLNDSAYLLAATAPETSRYLMSKCNAQILDNGMEQSDSQRRQACGACGTIMILGWRVSIHVDGHITGRKTGKVQKESQKPKPKSQKDMVYSCTSCGRETRFTIPTPPSVKRKKTSVYQNTAKAAVPSPSLPENAAVTASANLSRKKRAKAKKGGLGALLANKKASDAQQSGFGLDLMDFLKKA